MNRERRQRLLKLALDVVEHPCMLNLSDELIHFDEE